MFEPEQEESEIKNQELVHWHSPRNFTIVLPHSLAYLNWVFVGGWGGIWFVSVLYLCHIVFLPFHYPKFIHKWGSVDVAGPWRMILNQLYILCLVQTVIMNNESKIEKAKEKVFLHSGSLLAVNTKMQESSKSHLLLKQQNIISHSI